MVLYTITSHPAHLKRPHPVVSFLQTSPRHMQLDLITRSQRRAPRLRQSTSKPHLLFQRSKGSRLALTHFEQTTNRSPQRSSPCRPSVFPSLCRLSWTIFVLGWSHLSRDAIGGSTCWAVVAMYHDHQFASFRHRFRRPNPGISRISLLSLLVFVFSRRRAIVVQYSGSSLRCLCISCCPALLSLTHVTPLVLFLSLKWMLSCVMVC